jgi:hypothetical protein
MKVSALSCQAIRSVGAPQSSSAHANPNGAGRFSLIFRPCSRLANTERNLSFRRAFLATLLPLFLAIAAHAQSAQLSGEVRDESKAVVPVAAITLRNLNTGIVRTTTTNANGMYVFTFIDPGNYKIIIEKQNFQTVIQTDIVLSTAQSAVLNFTLKLGPMSETITVNANAEHMPTDNPAVGLLVNRDFVESTPLNGRSFQDLIALAPGAVTSTNSVTGGFSINGQHDNSNYYTVDGVAANLNPNPSFQPAQWSAGTLSSQTALGTTQALVSVDALQEFKIQTSGYTAEYGRQPGGQIELTTRSGTNDIHGSLFDYFRNDALDANDWFAKQQGIPRQPERQNDFGGTIGGPVEVPMFFNGKDHTFYFVSYEGLRLTEPQFSGIRDVPTAAFRQFAASGLQPFLNSVPLPNVAGHLTNGDQCAASVGQTFSCTGEWAGGYSNPSDLDSISLRVDQVVGSKLQLFVRYFDTPSKQVNRSFGTQLAITKSSSHGWTLGTTERVSSNLVDELRFNYSASHGVSGNNPVAFDGALPYAKSLVIPPQYAPGSTPSQGQVVIIAPGAKSSQVPIAAYAEAVNQQQQYNLVDGLSFTRNTHTLKFGADYRRLMPLYNPAQYSSLFLLLSVAKIQQGVSDVAFIGASQKAHPIFNNLSLYAQDHWRLASRFTLDYGVRWEFNPAPGASDGLYPLALTTSSWVTTQLAPPGTPQYRTIYHNFAPRFGFAYQVGALASHTLVIRTGFGIFYDTGQAQGAEGYAAYPFRVSNVLSNISFPISAASIVPPPLNSPLVAPYPNINAISDPNLKLPYTEQWNLSADLGLSARNTLTVSYVGNVGRKLLFSQEYTNLSSVNPAFTDAVFVSNAGSSSYNALQVQDQGYVAPGLQLIASYTWAHALDNSSTDNNGFPPIRGNSDNDIRHVLNAALNYQIPGGGNNAFARALIKGWSVDSRFTAQTGYPVDVNQGSYLLPNSVSALIRPDLVPSAGVYLHNAPGALGGWALNPTAFSPVPTDPNTGAPLRQGTLGRNFIHGPGFWNLNEAVQRNFTLHERLRLIFRAEAFNIFNHPNAGNIDNCLCDSSFGQSHPPQQGGVPSIGVPNRLYATGGARSLQLLLKLQF